RSPSSRSIPNGGRVLPTLRVSRCRPGQSNRCPAAQPTRRARPRFLGSPGRTGDGRGRVGFPGVGGRSIVAGTFPGGTGRWEVRTGHFRQGGIPLELLVLTDVSPSLRDEERQAWQRLIRVIGHEINNSLAPIKSISHSLERILTRDPKPPDWETDMRSGLQVVGS